MQSNLTEGFDTVPTVRSTQEIRRDLSGSQDTDSSLSGEERLIQQNTGEVQVGRITITQGITLQGSEAVRTSSSGVGLLHPCPSSHALGWLLPWELKNNK